MQRRRSLPGTSTITMGEVQPLSRGSITGTSSMLRISLSNRLRCLGGTRYGILLTGVLEVSSMSCVHRSVFAVSAAEESLIFLKQTSNIFKLVNFQPFPFHRHSQNVIDAVLNHIAGKLRILRVILHEKITKAVTTASYSW